MPYREGLFTFFNLTNLTNFSQNEEKILLNTYSNFYVLQFDEFLVENIKIFLQFVYILQFGEFFVIQNFQIL